MTQETIKSIKFSLSYRLYDNALLLCQEAFHLNPQEDILNLYIRSYLESGSPIQASILCKKYCNYIWNNIELVILFIQCLFESGKYDESELICIKGLEKFNETIINEQKSVIKYYLGLISQRTHRHDIAGLHFIDAYDLEPSLITCIPYINKDNEKPGKSLLTPRLLREKKKPIFRSKLLLKRNFNIFNIEYEKKINKFSQNPFLMKTIAYQYFRSSKYNECIKLFQQLYQEHPYYIDGIDIYSTALWHLKEEKILSILAQNVLNIAPNRSESWIAMGNLLSLQRKSEDAIEMFHRAANINKMCSYALALAGHEHLLNDSLLNATKLFRESIDRCPFEWSSWYGLGSVHYKQDNFNAAKYYIKKAIEYNPYSSVLFYVYAMVLRKCDEDDLALEMIEKSNQLDPNNIISIYQKGLLLENKGNLNEALKCMEIAESLSPQEPSIAFYQGKMLQSMGKGEEASKLFADALIYGYHDKKELHSSMENIVDKVISDLLK